MSTVTPLSPTEASIRTVPDVPADKRAAPEARDPVAGAPAGRLQSLDAYRGLIMVALAFNGFGLAATARNFLRTSSGDSGFWGGVYHHFEHVEWSGCGFWDLIQPSFMFMVGVSMAYSYVTRQRQGQSWWRMFGHASWRALLLVALGIFLTSSNPTRGTNWQFTNVLCQIGLGYAFLFLLWGRTLRTHVIVAAALLLGTWALYTTYPGSGVDLAQGAPQVGVPAAWAQEHLRHVAPAWHKNANIGHHFDLWLLNLLPRRETFTFNSGGYHTLNFIPALATMLFGLMCGELLRSNRAATRKLVILLAAGLLGLALGTVWSWLGTPIVKRIWTPSWALYSTGWCILILAALYAVIDVRQWRAWSFPLVVVGMNSIAIYSMGMLLRGWTAGVYRTHLGEDVFKIFGANAAPFVQATMVGLAFWLVCYWMYRRKIFLRI